MENRLVDMRELYQEWQDYLLHNQDNQVSIFFNRSASQPTTTNIKEGVAPPQSSQHRIYSFFFLRE